MGEAVPAQEGTGKAYLPGSRDPVGYSRDDGKDKAGN